MADIANINLADPAVGVTGLLLGGAALWRFWLSYRRDKREDATGEKTQSGWTAFTERQEKELTRQGEVIERLATVNDALRDRYNTEVERRQSAETEATFKGRKVAYYEDIMRELGMENLIINGTIPEAKKT